MCFLWFYVCWCMTLWSVTLNWAALVYKGTVHLLGLTAGNWWTCDVPHPERSTD